MRFSVPEKTAWKSAAVSSRRARVNDAVGATPMATGHSGRQALTPFGPATLQDQSALGCGHASPEPMGTFTLDIAGLESTLHGPVGSGRGRSDSMCFTAGRGF